MINKLNKLNRLGIGQLQGPTGGALPGPVILHDGNTVAWYDFMQAVTKDGGNAVSLWADFLGSGNDVGQATPVQRPIWSANGITFDGVTDSMLGVYTLNQPETVYAVVRLDTWVTSRYLFDGGGGVTDSGALQCRTATPGLRVTAGLGSSANNNLPVGQFGVVRIHFNGATSSYQIDNTTKLTGNWGTNNMGGVRLGSQSAGSFACHCTIKEYIVRKIDDAAQDDTDIYNYLKDKYGL